ncbi:MAG: ABC transporter permease [Anaerolineae bacterium]|nr:ABC transporter permease [Anaerolineae bacterium]
MLEYIGRRLLLMVMTLIVISVLSFAIIQLPPGDFLTAYIERLEESGLTRDQAVIESLKKRYGLDQPIYVQYGKWVWGMLHGDFGQSFLFNRPVGELIWERLGLTMAVSFAAMVFNWVVALPIGIYSAVRQYSIGDYVATFIGFIGLAIPNFMLALILMWLAFSLFGANVGGLFSAEYADAPWTWAKVVDMLKHLWLPMVVLGMAGTAGLIRIMRANLLDELRRPYVITARAKGLPETRLILKYPVRVALNPFVSTIGWSLAGLVAGETIVSIVLGLPTTGPLLFRALMMQDMYLAGTFIMMVSALTVIGTLISDILLAWIDPRIRQSI